MGSQTMGQFGLGQPVRRLEDPRLLMGDGRFADDISVPNQAYAFVVRSPHAHAIIRSIDIGAAIKSTGFLGVLTGADAEEDGIGLMPCLGAHRIAPDPTLEPPRPILTSDRVRYVGDCVALVIAETPDGARDAAERIYVDYEPLPAVCELADAVLPDAPTVFESVPGNLCTDVSKGDGDAVKRALLDAAHVTRLRLINNRVIANPMEPRAALGMFEQGRDRFTLFAPTQGVHSLRNWLADHIFDLPRHQIRVVTDDVGGGFGVKMILYPEYALVLWAARRFGRPVKWSGDRSEAFLSDAHGRDHVTDATLGLDADGRILALEADTLANMGAYLTTMGPYIPIIGANLLSGVYTVPHLHTRIRCVMTNTVPLDAYRGAGRPEAAYVIERMIEAAAGEMGLAPEEIRRRNIVPANAIPYTTCFGETFDSGDFAGVMDAALDAAGWTIFADRQAESAARGMCRGIGFATYIEACGGGSDSAARRKSSGAGPDEMAEIRVDPTGSVSLFIGSQCNGQGHATAFTQIIADRLGIAPSSVRVLQGDTDVIPYGAGTGYSRSVTVGGVAVEGAALRVRDKAVRIAAEMLEAAAEDIEVTAQDFRVAGTDRAVTFAQIATRAYSVGGQPDDADFGLIERYQFVPTAVTYPNGCHVCEIEVDPETGAVTILRFTVVDDFGRVVNPMLLDGQVHGGCGQGIGQALLEDCRYDGHGQLLSASFLDYCLPRADDLPTFSVQTRNIPCETNPLGLKGAGEAGAIGAPPAVINAIVNALAQWGVTHIDMPATPERVWKALRQARERPAVS